jgi:outer membrane protein assembly factor BamB
MTTDSALRHTAPPVQADPATQTAAASAKPRLWLPLTLIALYWALVGVSYLIETPIFYRFLAQSAALLAVILVFLVWWAFNRRIKLRDRLTILAATVASPVLAMFISHKSLGPFPVFSGLPILFTAWVLWLLFARNASHGVWKAGLITFLFLSTGVFALLRMEGLTGAGRPDFKWRWSPGNEDRYLARRTGSVTPVATPTGAISLRPGDWPGFRGQSRDSVVRGLSISTDWNKAPPRQIWRRPIGPGWSSMSIVDGRLFTHEQRGENEAVVCLDAATGADIWSHEEFGRFWDPLSSAGPRATPTFADGRIYAQGATGTLLCLDAATGRKIWSRNTLADSGGKLPDWGVAGSPLVVAGVVIACSAGQSGKALLGYRADSGDLAWTADAGVISYSSPHLATIGGRQQVLFISDKGLISVDPSTGKTLWEYAAQDKPPRSLQPLAVSETQILVPLGMEAPTDLVDVARGGEGYTATKRWTSRNLKPSFNDFVLYDGHVYGFDGGTFTCVELKTGNRKWKKGRYGTGQVLLLADQPVLLVLSDQGKVVLVAPKPDGFDELGQFEAITGKTWNHPAVAHGRLYVRNSQEIACYDLAVKSP